MPNQYDTLIPSGTRFGQLTIIRRTAGRKIGKQNKTAGIYLCKCDCGKVKPVLTTNLKQGWSKSCGCLKLKLGVAIKTHGHTSNGATSTEYRIWANMKQRCLNRNTTDYNNYGGRGISICKRWLRFENFYKDMGNRPRGLQLERKDNNGNYEPPNCKWATRKEEQNNKRTNRKIVHDGKSAGACEWAEITGIPRSTISARINKLKWDDSRAVTTSRKK